MKSSKNTVERIYVTQAFYYLRDKRIILSRNTDAP